MVKKYEQIYQSLKEQILNGDLRPGSRIPAERQLMDVFGVSRPTIRRALEELASEGVITRRVGSGSYVAHPRPAARPLSLGLLVPGLGRGEIFEPICARIAELSQGYNFTLSWGATAARRDGKHAEEIVETARRFVAQAVDGVFFQPVELVEEAPRINQIVVDVLTAAGIPIVLIDADYLPFPEQSPHDLVGIDNARAAYVATEHLCSLGAGRVDFVWRPHIARTVHYRRLGYRQALLERGITPRLEWEHQLDPEDSDAARTLCASGARDLLCANDETAALLMRTLEGIGCSCPQTVRIVGFDDVKYARLVKVPLTTIRQPCNDLAEVAVQTMLSRIAAPHIPPRAVYVGGRLIVRESSLRPEA